jgi:hypothetical protein
MRRFLSTSQRLFARKSRTAVVPSIQPEAFKTRIADDIMKFTFDKQPLAEVKTEKVVENGDVRIADSVDINDMKLEFAKEEQSVGKPIEQPVDEFIRKETISPVLKQ